jgi:hypothetical protein
MLEIELLKIIQLAYHCSECVDGVINRFFPVSERAITIASPKVALEQRTLIYQI